MRARAVAAVTLFALQPGCAGQAGRGAPGDAPIRGPVVEVTNDHAQDMKVYLWPLPGAARWRLGTVPAQSRALLAVPRPFWGREVRLVLQPFASRREEFVTPQVVLDRGWVLDLRVQSVLARSFVFER